MSARTAAHPRVPSATLRGAQTDSRYGNQPSLRPALPLYPDAQKAVEHCRHSLSKEALSSAHCSQSGRSNTAQPPPAGWVTSLLSNTSARPPNLLPIVAGKRTMKKALLVLAIVLGAAFFVCLQTNAGQAKKSPLDGTWEQTMTIKENKTNNEAAIREVIDSFADAFRARDVNGVMSVFAPEIVSFDIVPPLEAVGAETFVKHWQEFFEAYQGTLHVEFPDISITVGDDVAFSHCLLRVKGTMKTGQQTDWWLRWTACYRKTNGKWIIVHEQVSVPIDFRSGKAMLDLKP